MCGVAMLVPLMVSYALPGTQLGMSTPGPTMSGTSGSSGRAKRWLHEKSATAMVLSHAPTDSTLG